MYRHRGGNQAPSMPGRPAVSRVLFPRRGGPPRRGRRPFISTRRCRRALPGLACADRESGLPAVVGPRRGLWHRRPLGLNLPPPAARRVAPRAGDRCLALHPVGFAVPAMSPSPRCALTAPFHPYPPSPEASEGGLLSVALSLSRLAHGPHRTVGVTHHRGSVVLGLSSARPKADSGLPPADLVDYTLKPPSRPGFFSPGRSSPAASYRTSSSTPAW